MIKEAINYLFGLGEKNVRIEVINGRTYTNSSFSPVILPTPKAIGVRTLKGLVDYIKTEFDTNDKLMVHIVDPTTVRVFSALNQDVARNHYVQADAILPEFEYGRYLDPETFIIKLQSGFGWTEDRDVVLKVIGNVKEENVTSYGDDGVSQAVVAKAGVATVEQVKVPNPVILKPYRTFVEVEQPSSAFVFRMKQGPTAALFEADGGAWRISAMNNIREHLTGQLAGEVEAGKVYIVS